MTMLQAAKSLNVDLTGLKSLIYDMNILPIKFQNHFGNDAK